MSKDKDQGLNRLEKLKSELYGKDEVKPDLVSRSPLPKNLSPKSTQGSSLNYDEVDQLSQKKRSMKNLMRLLVVSFVFFIGAGAFSWFRFTQNNSTVQQENISIEILGKSFVDGGEDFTLLYQIKNNNPVQLELAQLFVEYPLSDDDNPEISREIINVDTLLPGETKEIEYGLVLFGEQGTRRPIEAKLQYRLQGSNAIFTKTQDYEVTLRSTPIEILVDASTELINQQDLPIEITVNSQSQEVVPAVTVIARYPGGFQYEEASPEPVQGNNIWYLGDLPPGASRTITLNGKMKGVEGDQRSFSFQIGQSQEFSRDQLTTVYNTALHTLELTRPFLNVQVFVDGNNDIQVPLPAGEEVSGSVVWSNTTTEPLANAIITLDLNGRAIDLSSVRGGGGFYDSNTQKIIWDSENSSDLSLVEPGEEETFDFDFTTSDLVGSSSPQEELSADLSVSVQAVNPSGETQLAEGVAKTQVRLISEVNLVSSTFYNQGPIQNTGPVPPRTEQYTTYTLAWALSNSSNELEDVRVSTVLPAYVQWLEETSPGSENITYNPVTREVEWRMDRIDPGVGFSDPAREVFFRVGIQPSASQSGDVPNLANRSRLRATDVFTGEDIRLERRGQTTKLSGEEDDKGVVE